MKLFGAYSLMLIGIVLGVFAFISTLTSVPQFMDLDMAKPFSWGFIGGRVIVIVLLFLIAKAAFGKGKRLKALTANGAEIV